MPAFPDVTLATDYVAQTEYKSNTVNVLQIEDRVDDKSLRAFVQLGDDNSFKYWIPVMSGDDYTVNWTNDDVTAAIQAYFADK